MDYCDKVKELEARAIDAELNENRKLCEAIYSLEVSRTK